MAAALFNSLRKNQQWRALSAGTNPTDKVHAEVIIVMAEVGLDLTETVPNKLTDDLATSAAMLITMGCGEQCPYIPGLVREDWQLKDPKGQSLPTVRQIRDEIKSHVEILLSRIDN